jgi:hypothetical protein
MYTSGYYYVVTIEKYQPTVATSLTDKRMQIKGRQALQTAEVPIGRASSSFILNRGALMP